MQAGARDKAMAVTGLILRASVYITLALPAVIVVISSFTAGESLRFPPEGFSLKWYKAAVNSEPFMTSLWVSVRLACISTVLSLLIGLPAAFALDRYAFRGKELFRTLALSPLVVPMVVLGLGLLQFMAWLGWNQTFWSLLTGHVLITLPYVVRTLTAGFFMFDKRLEQAAMNLRATPWTVLRRITLPLLAPSVISAGVFAFVASFGNITISVFLGFGGETTLPVQIFTYVEHSYDPILAAVSTLVIVVTLTVIAIVEKFSGMDNIV
ncbi:MAG: ABC transporter permease [Desulfovibrio sp.]|jgi:putative spermidine/putrescine transport system permease protein|nr:ABC transporter permease [Desulfovibrio sp.]